MSARNDRSDSLSLSTKYAVAAAERLRRQGTPRGATPRAGTPRTPRLQRPPTKEEEEQRIKIQKARADIRSIPGTVEVMDAIVEYVHGKRRSVKEELQSEADSSLRLIAAAEVASMLALKDRDAADYNPKDADKVKYREFRRWIIRSLDIGGYFTKKQIENALFVVETTVPGFAPAQKGFVSADFEEFVVKHKGGGVVDTDPVSMNASDLSALVFEMGLDVELRKLVLGLCQSVKATLGVAGLEHKLWELGFKDTSHVPTRDVLHVLQEAGVPIQEKEVILPASCGPGAKMLHAARPPRLSGMLQLASIFQIFGSDPTAGAYISPQELRLFFKARSSMHRWAIDGYARC